MKKSKTKAYEQTTADYIFDLYHELKKERTRIDVLEDQLYNLKDQLDMLTPKPWPVPWFRKDDMLKAWQMNLILVISIAALVTAIIW